MAKVLVLATSPHTHGGISSVVKLHSVAPHWRENDCRWIVTHRDGSAVVKLAAFIRALAKYVCALPGADIVHIHTSQPPSALRKSVFAVIALILGKKLVTHLHCYSAETSFAGRYKMLYSFLFRHSAAVVAISPGWERELTRHFPQLDNITVIPNPCRQAMPDTERGRRNQVLFAGRIIPRKGYETLLRAFAMLSDDFPQWRLVMAGDGESRKAIALAERLGIADKVDMPGWVEGEAMDRLLSESSVFCLPSLYEGFPMAVIEAWSHHLAVVCTPVGGIADVARHGESVMFYNTDDIEDLTRCLSEVLRDEGLRNRLAENGAKTARSAFGLEAVSARLDALYKNSVDSGRQGLNPRKWDI